VVDGWMYGRGATDMKSGVAAFAAAAVDFVRQTPPDGAVILTITGDEEDVATDGTVALLDWMATEGERMTHCLVGEPTCPNEMGEMMKIGRRGSMTCWFTAKGVQGHSAYPHRSATAGSRHRPFRPLDPRDHHHRLRQPGQQRHPGQRHGHGQYPLQRSAHGGQPVRVAAQPCSGRAG
jgi:acetylornithine deacetylase/succinyl-diaminopimelate desuccinylase-like protein